MGRPSSEIRIHSPERKLTLRDDPPDPHAPTAWHDTLRWQDAPDLLLVNEAALLMRCSEDVLYKILGEQRIQAEHGMAPQNPLRVWRRGDGRQSRIRIPKRSLWEYVAREAGLTVEAAE